MNKKLLRVFMGFNVFLIHASRGKIGTRLGHQRILLMHTIGRKTGKHFTTPIAYFPNGMGYYVIASNWGREKNAAWYFNLKEKPDIEIEVEGETIAVRAREVTGSEYAALWANAVQHHPDYQHYKESTSRHIPIIQFDPIE